MSLKDIGTGWGRWLKLLPTTPEIRTESERRLKICDGCIHAQPSKFLEVISDSFEEVKSMYCELCSCPCHQKSLTSDVCPIGQWNTK